MNFDESRSDESGSDESQTTRALVPMVDLFAVLAVVFMIHSQDEIAVSRQETENHIDEIVATAEKESLARLQKESEAKADY